MVGGLQLFGSAIFGAFFGASPVPLLLVLLRPRGNPHLNPELKALQRYYLAFAVTLIVVAAFIGGLIGAFACVSDIECDGWNVIHHTWKFSIGVVIFFIVCRLTFLS